MLLRSNLKNISMRKTIKRYIKTWKQNNKMNSFINKFKIRNNRHIGLIVEVISFS